MLRESDAKQRALRDENIVLRAQVDENKNRRIIAELEKELEELEKENALLKRALNRKNNPSTQSDTITKLKKVVKELMAEVELLSK